MRCASFFVFSFARGKTPRFFPKLSNAGPLPHARIPEATARTTAGCVASAIRAASDAAAPACATAAPHRIFPRSVSPCHALRAVKACAAPQKLYAPYLRLQAAGFAAPFLAET